MFEWKSVRTQVFRTCQRCKRALPKGTAAKWTQGRIGVICETCWLTHESPGDDNGCSCFCHSRPEGHCVECCSFVVCDDCVYYPPEFD